MVENLLQYSRSGTINEKLQNIDLEATLQEVMTNFTKVLDEIGGAVRFDLEVETARVYPTLFKRLVGNLTSNAIKYRSERPLQIFIRAREKKRYYELSVVDNGIGIDNQYLESIFKIFTSLKPSADSNGIGLSICKKIAELHDGEIQVQSEPGEGSEFTFTIARKTGN